MTNPPILVITGLGGYFILNFLQKSGYTTFIATVKIPFSKKNTSSHYFLQYIPFTRSVTGMYCIVNYPQFCSNF